MRTKIVAIIPARYESSRFRGKPLVKIAGISMIERVYRQVEKSNRFSDILVATDNEMIANEVKTFGGHFEMTSKNMRSGTDRVWEVLNKTKFEGAVNIQGDEPLISEKLIALIYDTLKTFKYNVVSATFFNNSYEDFQSPDIVKVVLDESFQALYFSRSPIPFIPLCEFKGFNQHIGIYGYLRNSLEKFVNLSISTLEKQEKLEQLRFLSNNFRIKMIKSDCPSISVDVPKDVKKIEDNLKTLNE